MRRVLLGLTLLCLTAACGPSTAPLLQPTVSMQRPSECLTACPLLPYLTEPDEIAYLIWTHEVIDLAGQCRRMHETCRKAKE
jgi:hypothetical protein